MSDVPPQPPSLRYFINGTLFELTGQESIFVSAGSNITVQCQYHDPSEFAGIFFKLSLDLETQLALSQRAFSRRTVGDDDFPLPGYGTSSYFEFYSKKTSTLKYNDWRLKNNDLKLKISLVVSRDIFNYTISGVVSKNIK